MISAVNYSSVSYFRVNIFLGRIWAGKQYTQSVHHAGEFVLYTYSKYFLICPICVPIAFCLFKGGELLCLNYSNYFEKSIYPYLLNWTNNTNEMWIMGAGGQGVTINSFYATALLRFSPTDCVIAPEASGEVLESLGELLHTGRFSIVSRWKAQP